MKTLMLGWLSLLLVGTVLSAQNQAPIRSLLRVHSSHSQAGHGLRLADGDLFISTDRSVESLGSLAQNVTLLPPPWLRVRQLVVGSPQDFATLNAALADNRVGEQSG